MKKKRDYRREYDTYHGLPDQIQRRSMRNQARRKMLKSGKIKPKDKREIDHKNPLSKGGTNNPRNLRAISKSTNRKKGSNGMAKKKISTGSDIVQRRNPKTGHYSKIDRKKGRVLGQKKTPGPYKNVPIARDRKKS